LRVTGF